MKTALGMAAVCVLISACGVVESPLIPGSQTAAAKDQIMLVRSDPPSFGYERLVKQCRDYPEIARFVTKHGIPDFFAEAGNPQQRFYLLYYLASRHAFACRKKANSASIELSGPYPITAGEYKLLDGFRKASKTQSAL